MSTQQNNFSVKSLSNVWIKYFAQNLKPFESLVLEKFLNLSLNPWNLTNRVMLITDGSLNSLSIFLRVTAFLMFFFTLETKRALDHCRIYIVSNFLRSTLVEFCLFL